MVNMLNACKRGHCEREHGAVTMLFKAPRGLFSPKVVSKDLDTFLFILCELKLILCE